MSVLKLAVTSGRPSSYLTAFQVAGGKHARARKILNFLESLQTGTELATSAGSAPSIAITVQDSEVQASGTLTCVSVVATDTATINGVAFTAVASGATGNQFNVGVDDTATALNLKNAINASATALVSGYVTATSALGVVTVTSAFYGLAGNMTTLASAGGTITVSGARLTGGAADASASTLSF